MKLLRKESGFSFVELIVAIVILGLAYGVMLGVFTGLRTDAAHSELYTKAIFLGKELMSTILSKAYDENAVSPWTVTESFGLDLDDATYDDVDDFAEYVDSAITGFPGFTQRVRVFYVNPQVSLDDSVNMAGDIKKIIVTVTHADLVPVALETLLSSHY